VGCLRPTASPICVCVRPALRRPEIVKGMFMKQIIGTPILKVNRNSNLVSVNNIGMSIGQRIRAARKNAKLTQAELAAKVGMKQGSLSELETGESTGTTLVASIAAALGVSALWLETGKGVPNAIEVDRAEAEHEQKARMILAWEDEINFLDLYRRTDDLGRIDLKKLAQRHVDRVEGLAGD
jgi:transcriptional regulator with XRE-family HTH domain